MIRSWATEPCRRLQTLLLVGVGGLASGCAAGPNKLAGVSLDVSRGVQPRLGASDCWTPWFPWQANEDAKDELYGNDAGLAARLPFALGVDGDLGNAGTPGVAEGVSAADVSEAVVREAVERRFPGAVIREIEQDRLKGQSVAEVELVDKDNNNFEVLISSSGEFLSVEEQEGLPWIGGELGLGFALRGERDIYKDAGTESELSPLFMYENGPLQILGYDGIDASLRFLGNDWLALKARGSIVLEEGYDPSNSNYFEGMDELSTLYYAGLQLEAVQGNWMARLEVLQDISGEHRGQEIDTSLFYTKEWYGIEVRPELSVTLMSSDAVDYFFGVSEEEARPDRPAYSPGTSFEVGIGVLLLLSITKRFSAVALFEASAVGGEIKESPLVDSNYELEAALGFIYSF